MTKEKIERILLGIVTLLILLVLLVFFRIIYDWSSINETNLTLFLWRLACLAFMVFILLLALYMIPKILIKIFKTEKKEEDSF